MQQIAQQSVNQMLLRG